MGPWRRRSSGFTLVEVLITLFVIALLAGVVVISMGNNNLDEEVHREALRFERVVELARQEALFEGVEWGLALDAQGYRFLRLDEDDDRWRDVSERPFDRHDLPERFSLRLTVADRGRVDGRSTRPVLRGRAGVRPSLLLLSSGETTPFTVRFVHLDSEAAWRIDSDGFSELRLRGTS